MDIKVQKRTAELLYQLIKNKENTTSHVTYAPQKEAFLKEKKIEQPFPRSTPEEQGVDSAYLISFLEELQQEKEINTHSIVVVRNGRIILEGAFSPYQLSMWHVSHSMCKSITALAIGMMVDEGRITVDDKIMKLIDTKINPIRFLKQKNMTVYHLLTMSTGVVFGELGAVTENDWLKSYFESNIRFELGEKFAYNSMNSYILSVLVKEVTGMGMMEYLKPRLWEPLGIKNVYWEKCPKGIEKGGWGLYLCPEDMAKIGQLLLQKGTWRGEQIISSEWITEMCTKKIDTPKEMGEYGYGYQIWMAGRKGGVQCNGMLGQNIIVYPDINTVIVTTAGSNELFQESRLGDLIHKYFEMDFQPKDRLPNNKGMYQKLVQMQRNLKAYKNDFLLEQKKEDTLLDYKITAKKGWKQQKNTLNQMHHTKIKGRFACNNYAKNEMGGMIKVIREILPKECKWISNLTYQMEESGIGILPLFVQVFHNNYAKGIHQIHFQVEENTFFMDMVEGQEQYRIPIGFYQPNYTSISVNGEIYEIGSIGTFTKDEEEDLVLKIDIFFIETSNMRRIKCFFLENELLTKWNEKPGKDLIVEGLDSLREGNLKTNLMNLLMGKADKDYLSYRVRIAIEPELVGKMVTEIERK